MHRSVNAALLLASLLLAGSSAGAQWSSAADAGRALAVEVWPNPSSGEATVAVTLTEAGAATVAVYDVLGRRAAVLHEGPISAGLHAFPLDRAGLVPGLYVVRVAAGGAVRTARATLLR